MIRLSFENYHPIEISCNCIEKVHINGRLVFLKNAIKVSRNFSNGNDNALVTPLTVERCVNVPQDNIFAILSDEIVMWHLKRTIVDIPMLHFIP